jgi:D-glycero-D-manno-heptose 1,7-bisphosphate phosphatase
MNSRPFDTRTRERLNSARNMSASEDRKSALAVFLDREGVITPKLPIGVHVTSPEQAVLAPGAAEALRRLSDAGCRLFIVSNQSGISRGYLTQADADRLHGLIVRKLAENGVLVEDSRLCPHRNEDGCTCRKPKPGMIADLCNEYGIDPAASAIIGDFATDVEAGRAAGCGLRVHLVQEGEAPADAATHHAADLGEAVRIVLERSMIS